MKTSKRVVLGALVALFIGGCAGTQGSQLAASAPPAGGTVAGPSQAQPEVVASQQTANGRELPVMGQAPAPAAAAPDATHAQAETTTEPPVAGEPTSETPAPTRTHHRHRKHRHRRHHHHKKVEPAPAPSPAE